MPTTSASPTVSPAASVLFILSLFDPRRWIGVLFSILGVLASVIVPFLPAGITKPLSNSKTIVIVPRHSHARSASQASQTSPATPAHAIVPLSKLSNRRHTSLNSATESRPSTPLLDISARTSSSSSSIAKIDPTPSLTLRRPGESIYSENVEQPIVLPIFSQAYGRDTDLKPRQSLDSLDLATTTATSSSILIPRITAKVTFRMPDLTGLKGLSSDYRQTSEDKIVSSVATLNTIRDASEIPDWRGNAVRRSITLPSPAEALSARRKCSLLQRDILVASVQPAKEIVLPTSSSPPPEDLPPSDNNNAADAFVSGQFLVPPERPMRTDPYKKFNIPAPGTERARAFLKAEKEWVKAETERRKKVINMVAESVAKQAATVTINKEVLLESEKSETEGKELCPCKRNRLRRRSLPASRKSTMDDEAVPFTAPPELGSRTDGNDENDQRLKLAIPQIPTPDEFGVIAAPLSAVPEETASALTSPQADDSPESSMPQRLSPPGKRLWMFSKRSQKGQGETRQENWKEETIESKKKPGRPKLRHDNKSIGLGTKQRGHISDTALTSLTY